MRITDKDLEAVVRRLNIETGSPVESYVKDETGKFRSQPGNYHLDYAYGGVAVDRMVGTSGGVTVVIERGTKRETYEKLHAFLRGYAAARA